MTDHPHDAGIPRHDDRDDQPPLHCAEVLELLTEHLEHALAEADQLLMDAHLAGCEDCRIRLRQLQRTIALIGEAGRRLL